MKWLVFVLFFTSLIEACSGEKLDNVKNLYEEITKDQVLEKKIVLLQAILHICYSPEVEANLYIMQAETSSNVETKVILYKKSLISISKFKDKTAVIKYQNAINEEVATLLENKNPKFSKIYISKNIKEENDSSPQGYLWVIIILGVLFFWGVYKNIARTLKR